MRLFIAEKPDLAKAICAGFGGGFSKKDGYFERGDEVVTWCYGHMLQLFNPKDYDEKYGTWKMEDLPFVFLPVKRKYNSKTAKQTKVIKSLLEKADVVVNAGDPDDEGQLLVDELIRHFNYNKPVKRILINDNNTKVVAKALNNLKPNSDYEHLGYQAEARTIADQLFGFNLTRAYTLNSQAGGGDGVISIGRVQTPILGLIVRRDRENKAHKKSYFYDVFADFIINNVSFTATYQPKELDPTLDNGKLSDKAVAEQVAQFCMGKLGTVISANTQEKKNYPPLPYNLLKLQQDGSRKYGLKPDKTLAITQSLREKHKLITYNRSDCQYLSDEQYDDVDSVLNSISQTAQVLAGAIGKADSSIKGRVFNSKKVSAHHAIIPTETVASLSELSEMEKNIYLLIARSYIAQFYPNYVFDSTNIVIDVEGYQFKVTAKVDKNIGWKKLYKNDKGNEEIKESSDVINIDLRPIKVDDKANCVNTTSEQKETKPPALYTMNTLLGDLTRVSKYVKNPHIAKVLKEKDKNKAGEHGGIGTPATRSSIIETLFSRGYIAEQKKNIVSTELGRKLYDTLDDLIRYPDMTAKWHEQIKNVKTFSDTHKFVYQVMKDVIEPEVARLKETQLNVVVSNPCPKCQRPLRRLKGEYGYFWSCTGYKDSENPCKHTMNDKNGKPVPKPEKKDKKPVELSEFDCPVCGSKLIHRKGKSKKGKKYSFFGCSAFPKCKQNYDEVGGKPKFEKE